ncbi:hypothetical protein SCHPADRAFT_994313 [Schizopora paradoxa]|uniref:DUF6697 domain-containing protein n=1 Tax=Schizopora paradoxa TaxID=27342 RepID=A0A0H2S0V4_9AGAM|nr:hypothetical protein SCHPADRAFT_994313 [Schizopora paradoxa]
MPDPVTISSNQPESLTLSFNLKQLIEENAELRQDLEAAQARILKLQHQNNVLVNEKNEAILKRHTPVGPAPTENLPARGPSLSVEVVIPSVQNAPSHPLTPKDESYKTKGPGGAGKSLKRPIEVLESDDEVIQIQKTKHAKNHKQPQTILPNKSKSAEPPLQQVATTNASGIGKKEFMEGLKNHDIKVKVKQAAIRLPDDSIYNRLRELGSPRFAISDSIPFSLLSTTTTRKELTAQFGGSSYTLLQKIAPERTAVHGYKRFLCPMLEMNPHSPQVPGAHGLMFRSGDDDDVFGGEGGGGKVGSQKELILVGIGEGKWLYMGDYELQKSDSLSKEEYVSVPLKVRNDWANKILTAKSGLRARSRISIFLRKQLGREPSPAEIHAKEAAQKKAKDKASIGGNMSIEDIKSAYEQGEEKLNVWVLKCTGYDEEFQQKLASFGANGPPQGGTSNGTGNQTADKAEESDLSDVSVEIGSSKRHLKSRAAKKKVTYNSDSDLYISD